MVITNKNVFILNTKDLSYIFHVDETGLLLHDYFGKRIEINDFDIDAIKQKITVAKGTTVIYKEKVNPNLSMDMALLEFSFPHKGDYRATPILLKNEKNGYIYFLCIAFLKKSKSVGCSVVSDFATPWNFSRQEYWSG